MRRPIVRYSIALAVLYGMGAGAALADACESSSFHLNNAEFFDVARAVSDLTGKSIALDKSVVKARVNFQMGNARSCSSVIESFLRMAMERGWLVRQTAHQITVVGAPENPLQPVRRMYGVIGGSALQFAERVRPLLSAAATIQIPDSRRILMIGNEDDHEVLQRLLSEIPQPLTLIQSQRLHLSTQ